MDSLSPDLTSDARRCGRCEKWLPLSEFYVEMEARSVAAGRARKYPCRSCLSDKARRSRAPRVRMIAEAKMDGCVDCGHVDLDHPEVFDLDHPDPDSKAPGGVAALVTRGTVEELAEEIAKCEVVCANCHRIRTKTRVAVTRGRSRNG